PAPAKPAPAAASSQPPAPVETAAPVVEAVPAPLATPSAEPAPAPVSVPARAAGHSLALSSLLLLAAGGLATIAFGRRLFAFSVQAVRR
ncbi:MAG: transglycosylase, partial [Actinomycetota bacterium]